MKVLITGYQGLIGSEAVEFFSNLGYEVIGIDNNMRKTFFGADGDTSWNKPNCIAYDIDIRDKEAVFEVFKTHKPDFVIHAAAQPSHDAAAEFPLTDFEINALGTMVMLEAIRQFTPKSPFAYLSTSKVYGEWPNQQLFKETQTRYEIAVVKSDFKGIDETCKLDKTIHSLFGASKLSADVMVQEYSRYFNIPAVCFRCGCLTGKKHSAAEAHGFLAYLAKCFRENRTYKIFGYKGKQVRENLHSSDVVSAIYAFFQNPKIGAVYNLGGGYPNAVSILEAITKLEALTGKKLNTEYVDKPRVGDHIWYVSDTSAFEKDYGWKVQKSIDDILNELI